jgi:hypothetical protein
MFLILNFDLFSGFSPANTRSAPMPALVLTQPLFLLREEAQLLSKQSEQITPKQAKPSPIFFMFQM